MVHFYTSRQLEKLILSCVLHYMIDVKNMACELLSYFKPTLAHLESIFTKAVELSCSAKFSDCESASILFALSLRWHLKKQEKNCCCYWTRLIQRHFSDCKNIVLQSAIKALPTHSGQLDIHLLSKSFIIFIVYFVDF
jgi:hypothetical protein